MFVRTKRRKGYTYAMLVESYRLRGKGKQRTIRNFGRLDKIDPVTYRQVLARYNTFYFLNEPRDPTPSALRNAHEASKKAVAASERVQTSEKVARATPQHDERYSEYDYL